MDEETLQAAIRAEQAAYVREWRRRNPEKARETNRRYDLPKTVIHSITGRKWILQCFIED